MKDHQIAALVNELLSVAKQYGHTQQLRERIAYTVIPVAQWKAAVLEACMSIEGCYKESDPRGTLECLINWHIQNERLNRSTDHLPEVR